MGSQQDFLEGLQALVRIGQTNDNVLTQEEIRDYFSDIELDEEKMSLLSAYMAENQIHIEGILVRGISPEEDTIHSEEQPSAALQMYLDEMGEIESFQSEAEDALVNALENGDRKAADQLLEMNLKEVVRLAKPYQGMGMQMNDLIQEGNLALYCAIIAYDRRQHGEFHPYITSAAKNAMEQSLEENNISTRMARKMARQINQMNEFATAIAKESGQEAKPEELARKMKISVEEVKDLMKISLDAVNAFENQ